MLPHKARVLFLVLEYQVKIQRGKTLQLSNFMYGFHKYSTFFHLPAFIHWSSGWDFTENLLCGLEEKSL
jgi:hypothetical protein